MNHNVLQFKWLEFQKAFDSLLFLCFLVRSDEMLAKQTNVHAQELVVYLVATLFALFDTNNGLATFHLPPFSDS